MNSINKFIQTHYLCVPRKITSSLDDVLTIVIWTDYTQSNVIFHIYDALLRHGINLNYKPHF